MKVITILSFCLAAAHAVNIRNYGNRDCRGSYRVCTNIAPNRCCYHAGAVFKSSSFHYLADTSFGLTCTGTANKPCQTVRAARHAGGCVQPVGSTTRLRGSYWFDCHQRQICPRAKDTSLVKATSSLLDSAADSTAQQAPDKVVIDGHVFNVDDSVVPAADIARLQQLVDDGVEYKDVPADLKKYEIDGPAAKAILMQ